MRLTLIEAPYDSGRFAKRLGRGPIHWIEQGLPERLRRVGHEVRIERIRLEGELLTEVGCATALQREIRRRVKAAVAQQSWPVILSGNCTPAALGATTAFPPSSTGVLWFDAHGDFNTPETSPSGFFDGMGLSVLTGESWQGLAASMEGFHPTPERNVLLLGARDLDAAESERVERSEVRLLTVEALRRGHAELERVLEPIAERVERLYVHLDLDVLDPSELTANTYAAAGGLTVDELEAVIRRAAQARPLGVAALTAYDPSADNAQCGVDVAFRLIETAVRGAERTG